MKAFLLLPLLAFLAVSCSSNTPATRIEQNPKIFRALSISQQSLVEVGKIENGMSPAAVFLAWGSPDRKSEGQKDKKRYEQWIYNSLSPVVVQSAWGGWGGYAGVAATAEAELLARVGAPMDGITELPPMSSSFQPRHHGSNLSTAA